MIPLILLLGFALILPGITSCTKSLFSGRRGPGLFQPLKNVQLLLRKGSVFSTTSTWIQQIAPSLSLAAVFCAALLVPFGGKHGLLSFSYDFVFFAYLIALGRFLTILAAFDAGSSFQGMGAAREGLYSLFMEPAFFVVIASFCVITGKTSFHEIFTGSGIQNIRFLLVSILSMFVFFNILLVENSRFPVDDPRTHLELTMIHEVMILDFSGIDLAFMHIVNFLKFSIFGTLIANCLVPGTWSFVFKILAYICIQCVFASGIGILESFRARNRLNKNVQYILTVFAVSVILFILTVFISI